MIINYKAEERRGGGVKKKINETFYSGKAVDLGCV